MLVEPRNHRVFDDICWAIDWAIGTYQVVRDAESDDMVVRRGRAPKVHHFEVARISRIEPSLQHLSLMPLGQLVSVMDKFRVGRHGVLLLWVGAVY
jgi:hypothetical protein